MASVLVLAEPVYSLQALAKIRVLIPNPFSSLACKEVCQKAVSAGGLVFSFFPLFEQGLLYESVLLSVLPYGAFSRVRCRSVF